MAPRKFNTFMLPLTQIYHLQPSNNERHLRLVQPQHKNGYLHLKMPFIGSNATSPLRVCNNCSNSRRN